MSEDDEYLSEGEICGYVAVIRSRLEPNADTDSAAATLIQDFCMRQWHGQPHSDTMLDWLSESLGKVLEHQSAQAAFGLVKRAKHAPKSAHKEQRDSLMIQWLAQARARGYGPSEASDLASDLFGTVRRNVERARKEWTASYADADWERIFLSMGCPLPPRK